MNEPLEQDKMMQVLIGNLLRFGVLIAAFFVLVGGSFYLLKEGTSLPRLYQFAGEPEALTQIPAILNGALQGTPLSLIQLGLLILIFIPIVRVVFSMLLFALEKDYLYVVITTVVLAVLLLGLLGNLAI